MSYVDEINKLFEIRRQAIAQEYKDSPLASNLLSQLSEEQNKTLQAAKLIQARLNYLKQMYDKSLEELKRAEKLQMWSEVAHIAGGVIGSLLAYYFPDLLGKFKKKPSPQSVSKIGADNIPETTGALEGQQPEFATDYLFLP